jgi:hypothetical protein
LQPSVLGFKDPDTGDGPFGSGCLNRPDRSSSPRAIQPLPVLPGKRAFEADPGIDPMGQPDLDEKLRLRAMNASGIRI